MKYKKSEIHTITYIFENYLNSDDSHLNYSNYVVSVLFRNRGAWSDN